MQSSPGRFDSGHHSLLIGSFLKRNHQLHFPTHSTRSYVFNVDQHDQITDATSDTYCHILSYSAPKCHRVPLVNLLRSILCDLMTRCIRMLKTEHCMPHPLSHQGFHFLPSRCYPKMGRVSYAMAEPFAGLREGDSNFGKSQSFGPLVLWSRCILAYSIDFYSILILR